MLTISLLKYQMHVQIIYYHQIHQRTLADNILYLKKIAGPTKLIDVEKV
jgi:hypothetical protein